MDTQRLITAAASLVILASGQASAALYTFPLPTGGGYRAASTQGWTTSHRPESGSTVTNLSSTAPDGNIGGVNQIGFGTSPGPANADGSSTSTTYLFSISDGTNQIFAASTTFAPQATTSISWDMGNNPGASTLVRLLVQSAGNWYATQTTYTTTNLPLGTFQSTPVFSSVNIATATWNQYDFSTMTVGSATTLASTTLTGVGFYYTNGANDAYTRLDNVNVIPEPTAALLGLVSAVSLTTRRRR